MHFFKKEFFLVCSFVKNTPKKQNTKQTEGWAVGLGLGGLGAWLCRVVLLGVGWLVVLSFFEFWVFQQN